ncbi:MAG: hypothetical protein JW821_16955 [Deltaproteobacteria bacterium]|nr:hypothetical protein [Deltaproteobacteria bacterium]
MVDQEAPNLLDRVSALSYTARTATVVEDRPARMNLQKAINPFTRKWR